MKARILRTETLELLRSQIKENLSLYRGGDFSDLIIDTSNWIELDVEVDEEKLSQLKAPVGSEYFEVENCIVVNAAFRNLKPYGARDERLWTYLTHTILLDHSRARWPIPEDDEKAVQHIQQHFFGREKRQIERDNAISRLWWMGHLCSRVPSMELSVVLRALLFRSDVRASIIERPTTSQSVPLFATIIKKLSQSYEGTQALFERNTFRMMMREINSVGGARLLDCLEQAQVETVIDGIIKNRLLLKDI